MDNLWVAMDYPWICMKDANESSMDIHGLPIAIHRSSKDYLGISKDWLCVQYPWIALACDEKFLAGPGCDLFPAGSSMDIYR